MGIIDSLKNNVSLWSSLARFGRSTSDKTPPAEDGGMALDLLSAFDADPDHGGVVDGELAVTDDVLVKAFALGPDGRISPHEHDGATNVFHVLQGTVTVERDEETETVTAPAVVLNERGQVHGAHNDTDEVAVLTASLCPLPGQ